VKILLQIKLSLCFLFLYKAKFIAQIIVLGGQIIGKAFAQALRQEFQGTTAIYTLLYSTI